MGDMIFTGASVDEAVASAKSVLGEHFEYEIVEEKKGLLGKVVKIRAWRPVPSVIVKKLLEDIMKAAGKEATIYVDEYDEGEIHVRIDGEDLAGFIGKHGKFLDTFEHFIDQVIRLRFDKPVRLDIDIMGYKARRAEKLLSMIEKKIQYMESRRLRSIKLNPMPRWERKIVHKLVQEHFPSYTTRSFGEEPNRRIEIKRVG
ncbi:hypothetical protein GM182_01665 [bacterium 3DAC]|nr:hypothetical protein [Dictyoglomota bacterium]UZN22645.1 hypothetical protein GM182_01665 [bacterium 3DAC]